MQSCGKWIAMLDFEMGIEEWMGLLRRCEISEKTEKNGAPEFLSLFISHSTNNYWVPPVSGTTPEVGTEVGEYEQVISAESKNVCMVGWQSSRGKLIRGGQRGWRGQSLKRPDTEALQSICTHPKGNGRVMKNFKQDFHNQVWILKDHSRLEYKTSKRRPSTGQYCYSGEEEIPGKGERSEWREVNGFRGI